MLSLQNFKWIGSELLSHAFCFSNDTRLLRSDGRSILDCPPRYMLLRGCSAVREPWNANHLPSDIRVLDNYIIFLCSLKTVSILQVLISFV